MKAWIIVLLLVTSAGAQTVTAALPKVVPRPTITPSQLALINSATSAGNCVTGVAHVYCATTSFADLFSTTACTPSTLLINANNDHTAGNDVVIVIPAGSTGNHGSSKACVPINSRLLGCEGNNVQSQYDCSFYMPQTFQSPANFSSQNWKKIFIISSHHSLIPPQGVRLLPRSGSGFLRPVQAANVAPADDFHVSPDLYGITQLSVGNSNDSNLVPLFLGNGANDYVFMDAELFTSSRFEVHHGFGELGYVTTIGYTIGAGDSGSRVLQVNFGGTNVFSDSTILIDIGQPLVSDCNVGSPTGPDCGQAGIVPGTPTLLYFTGLNTNFVQGRSTLNLVWNGQGFPASDTTVSSIPAGQCPAGAVTASTGGEAFNGNSQVGNLCVTDSTHAWASVTYTPTVPWNGGLHGYSIDTVPMTTAPPPSDFRANLTPQTCAAPDGTYPATPVAGGPWCAGTEHAFSNGSLGGWFDSTGTPQFTIKTCAGCIKSSSPDQAWNVPGDGAAHAIVIDGAAGATAPKTSWPTTPNTMLFFAMGNAVYGQADGTAVVANLPTGAPTYQEITGLSLTGGYALNQGYNTALSFNHSQWLQTNTLAINVKGAPIQPNVEADSGGWRSIRNMYSATAGIDFVGPNRQHNNWVSRGKSYTLDVWGVGSAINWTGISCSPGTTNVVNFGSDIAIQSCNPISQNHFTVTFFVCDGSIGSATAHPGCTDQVMADGGAQRNWLLHDYIHGSYGVVIHTGTSFPGNTDPMPTPVEILNWSVSGNNVSFTTTANSTIANGTILQLWGFQGSGTFLNHQQITVAGLSCTTVCTFTGAVSGGTGSASAVSGTVTSYSLSSNLLTLNLSPPIATVYAPEQPFFVSGFSTSTFLNNQILWVSTATTSQITAYICRCAAVSSYSVTNNVATTGFVAPIAEQFPVGATVSIAGPPTPISTTTGVVVSSNTSQITTNVSITANITGYSITNNLITFSVSPPMLGAFVAGHIIVLSGFPTSTFLNGQSLSITAVNNTVSPPTITAGFTHADVTATIETGLASMPNIPTTGVGGTVSMNIATTTETGQVSGIGAAGVPCQGPAPLISTTWVCFMADYEAAYNGLRLEGPYNIIQDSYLEAFPLFDATPTDTTGITMARQGGPALVDNNFSGGSSEPFFTGGGSTGLVQTPADVYDVTVVHNFLYNPPTLWVQGVSMPFTDSQGHIGACVVPRPDGRISCPFTSKDKYEQKVGARFDIHGNVMDGNWAGWFQTYRNDEWTPRLGQGDTGKNEDDINFYNNLTTNAQGMITQDSWDSACQYKSGSYAVYPPSNGCNQGAGNNLEARRVRVINNLHLINQIASPSTYFSWTQTASQDPIQINPYTHDWLISHNTVVLQQGLTNSNMVFVYGNPSVVPADGTDPTKHPYNVWVTNNVFINGTSASGAPLSRYIYQYPNATGIDINARLAGNVWNHTGQISNADALLPTSNNMTTTGTFTSTTGDLCQVNVNTGDPTTCYCLVAACGSNHPGKFQGNYQLTTPTGWLAGGGNTTDNLTAGIDSPTVMADTDSSFYGSLIAAPSTGITTPHIGPTPPARALPRPRRKL